MRLGSMIKTYIVCIKNGEENKKSVVFLRDEVFLKLTNIFKCLAFHR